jgi:hypothetical protein
VSEGAATSKSYSGLASGVWYFHVRAVDAAGNWGPAAHRSLRVDTVAPETSCPQDGQVVSAPLKIQLVATDVDAGVASISYGVDAAPSMAYTGEFTLAGSGVHTVNYRATDAAGNVEAVRSATITIDAPPTTTSSAPSAWVQTATVGLTCDDPQAVTSYRIDQGGWTTYSVPLTITDEGVHTVEYFSTAKAGAVEPVRSVTVRVDRTPPVVATDAAAQYADVAAIALSATDELSGVAAVEYKLDGAAWVAASEVRVTVPGAHTLMVRGTDVAGNTSAPLTRGFTVTPAPVLAPPTFSAAVSSTVSYRQRARVTGVLKSAPGLARSGRLVTLESSPDQTTWTSSDTTVTGPAGTFALYSPTVSGRCYLRVRFDGDSEDSSGVSPALLVKARLLYSSAPKFATYTQRYGSTYRVRGYFKPRHSSGSGQIKVRAYRYERTASGAYGYVYKRTFATKASNPSGSSYTKYTGYLRLPSRGKWRVRAYHAEDADNATSFSTYRYVKVK